ncbi:MAG: thiamine ABC transporter substrate-binding protein [Rhodobacteraceae bacterium]|nr:MAG: thiamine ABC transporter substrate-binding protein [Paracoccaceae bacterium]
MKLPTLVAGLLITTVLSAGAETRQLTIHAYDSFAKNAGPGIIDAFKEVCDCDIAITGVGSSGELLPGLIEAAPEDRPDLVLGIDTNNLAAARDSGLFAMHDRTLPPLDMPLDWDDSLFLPYNWGYYAFIYDSETVETPPASFSELVGSDLRVVIQDPNRSTTGLGLLMWVEAAFGDEAEAVWRALAAREGTQVVPRWADAYHPIFRAGEADVVLSYATSPAYHVIMEAEDGPRAARFDEGHYLRIEVAGLLADAAEPELARQFLDFMFTDGFQSVIPTTRWLYPVVTPAAGLPEAFGALIEPGEALLFPAEEAAARRSDALARWDAAFGE